MADCLLHEKRGAVILLTMDRPDERNALSTVEICDGFEERCKTTKRDTLGFLRGDGDAWLPSRTVECRRGQIPLDPYLEITGAFQRIAYETADDREALAAVFEKRTPSFKNR